MGASNVAGKTTAGSSDATKCKTQASCRVCSKREVLTTHIEATASSRKSGCDTAAAGNRAVERGVNPECTITAHIITSTSASASGDQQRYWRLGPWIQYHECATSTTSCKITCCAGCSRLPNKHANLHSSCQRNCRGQNNAARGTATASWRTCQRDTVVASPRHCPDVYSFYIVVRHGRPRGAPSSKIRGLAQSRVWSISTMRAARGEVPCQT